DYYCQSYDISLRAHVF
nr:immunoglobulin light chain junction region [Macaca mulatta]MOV95788.1 immunoglobulin light chain junction region [Macaca mulatta]MOV95846.1 immunoglobulin light chain junction region [Macaca mulatta]MOV96448.1 immunoglobulin light chain junction region [Macaca mulatta]MOV97189.1 immunoglobulin light chain junction region [Macaca mulatta]